MTSYIDANNGLTNFANIMGDDNTFDSITTNELIVNNSISLPNTFTGINVVSDNNTINISNFELSNLNNSRSNLQVQIDNLNPALNSNQGYWGNFWNNSTITAGATNTAYLIPYTNADAGNYGISYNNNSRVQVSNDGVYMFIATIQLYSTNANAAQASFWLKKNGVNMPDTAFTEELKQTQKLICYNYQLALNANDYIELVWQTTDTSIQLKYFSASGNIPAIPSVILTASQITYYQNNTAEVNGILQRITDITYTSNTDTTLISGNEDISGNLIIRGRATNTNSSLSPNTNSEYTTKYYVDQQVGIAYSRGTTGVNDAAAAQAKADSAYNLADQANNTANAAAGVAGGAAALGSANSAAIAGLTTSVGTLQADVAAIQGQIGTIDDEILSLQGKTQFQTANTATTTTAFSGNMSFGTQTTISSGGTLNTYEIGTNSAGVQNIRGATINIGGASGSYINIGTDGAFNSSISIGNLSVPIYIGGVLYLPFNPLAVGAQW